MRTPDRKTAEVRRLLEGGPHPAVPAELAARATELGLRMLHRRRIVRRALWLLLAVAVIVFLVWASIAQPWVAPPSTVTPPVEGL
jgi:ferric-dicitrate binding protein FerR (iron transport regulator)